MSPTASSTPTWPSLLVRIRDPQDRVSWQSFVDLYGPIVYAYCRRKHLQEADAADVTQDVLLEVMRSIRTFQYRPERGRFRDWLGAVTRRRLAHSLRRRHGRGGHAVDLEVADGEVALSRPPDSLWTEECCGRVVRFALEQVRAGFSPNTWRAFEAIWQDGRPAAHVAAELGLSVEAVYMAKSRVLKRLEDQVRLLAEDFPLDPTDTLPADGHAPPAGAPVGGPFPAT